MSPVGWERQALNSIQSVLGRPPGRQRAATGHPACELAAIRYDPQDTHRSDIDLWQRRSPSGAGPASPGGRCRCAEQDDLSART